MPHHTHSIDRWDDATGSNLYEHLAGVNDLLLARATFAAAVKRWPSAKITLRNGARIIEKTWPADRRHDGLWITAGCTRARHRLCSLHREPGEGPGEQHRAFCEQTLSSHTPDQVAGLCAGQRLHWNGGKHAEWRVPLAGHPRLIDRHSHVNSGWP